MTIWFVSEQFYSLSIAGKLAAIAGFVLVILLITLVDIYVAKRHATDKLPTEQLAENRPDENSSHPNCGDMPQHRKGDIAWQYPLGNILNNWRNNPIHYYSEHDRTTHNQPPLKRRAKPTRVVLLSPRAHIRTIVNWLSRRVNQSGKEPPEKCSERLPSPGQHHTLKQVTEDNKRWQERQILLRYRRLECYRRASKALKFLGDFVALRHV